MNPEGLTEGKHPCVIPFYLHTFMEGRFIVYPIINFNFIAAEYWPVFCLMNA